MATEKFKHDDTHEAGWYEVPYRPLPQAFAWLFTLLLTGLVMAMSLLHHFIPDSRRTWDFGQITDVPGASIYSSFHPSETLFFPALKDIPPIRRLEIPQGGPQLVPLPGARPLGGQRDNLAEPGDDHE